MVRKILVLSVLAMFACDTEHHVRRRRRRVLSIRRRSGPQGMGAFLATPNPFECRPN